MTKVPREVAESIVSLVPYDNEKLKKWEWICFFLLRNNLSETFFLRLTL